jgi:hypothetical protein
LLHFRQSEDLVHYYQWGWNEWDLFGVIGCPQ